MHVLNPKFRIGGRIANSENCVALSVGWGGGGDFLLLSLDDLGVFRSFLLHQGVDYKHKSSAHLLSPLPQSCLPTRDILTRWVRHIIRNGLQEKLGSLGKLLESITFFCAQISKCLRKFALFVLASSNLTGVQIFHHTVDVFCRKTLTPLEVARLNCLEHFTIVVFHALNVIRGITA
jgi:hypothetical protein